jgi:competence protein ComGC
MQNEKALTLLDVVVIFLIVSVVLLAGTILLRRVGKRQVEQATVDHVARRVACRANLYALGYGMELYANG